MLLYPHPINEAREARGELAMNSFWLSGCGIAQPADRAAVEVDASLRQPIVDGDTPGWALAWAALDAGPIARLLQHAEKADAPLALTLCGERSAQRYGPTPRSWWQRLRTSAPPVGELLAAL